MTLLLLKPLPFKCWQQINRRYLIVLLIRVAIGLQDWNAQREYWGYLYCHIRAATFNAPLRINMMVVIMSF